MSFNAVRRDTRVRWGWVALAAGALLLGVLLVGAHSTFFCASEGYSACGPTVVDHVATAVIVAGSLAAATYSLVRAFRRDS